MSALDDWALVSHDTDVRRRVLHISRRTDPDPWHDRVRDPSTTGAALKDLADKCNVRNQSPQILVILAHRMHGADADPVPFLRNAQRQYPADYWVNFSLGHHASNPSDKVGFYRAALAVRPGDADAHNNLGVALDNQKDFDGAVATFRRALAISPKYTNALFNLGNALREKGDLDGAIAACRQAIAIDPKFAVAHYNLGITLRAKGDLDGAIAAYRQTVAVDPKDKMAYHNLGNALRHKGDLDGAVAAYRQAIAIDERFAISHYSPGNALRDKGESTL